MTQPKTIESIYDYRTILFRSFMVFAYICFGSVIFHFLERNEASREFAEYEKYYNATMKQILSRAVSNDTEMLIITKEIRNTFLQDKFATEWSFLGGINISVQAITTIGYGNTVPKTVGGRMFLIIYAMIGIPLMAMMLTTLGDKLKHTIRSSIILFEKKILKKNQHLNIQRKCVFSVFSLTVVFLGCVSATSVVVENWDFSLALYVWFVTFTTIGFGDYVPQGSGKKNTVFTILETVYSLTAFFLGLTLIATILHTLSDWLNCKKGPTKGDLKQALNHVTHSFASNMEEISTHVPET